MTASAPIFQVFSYSEFPNQDSEVLAKDTFADLTGFALNYFDGLVKIGSKLCNVLEEILKSDKNGKKVFSKWLGSFGALEYLARNAIDIYNWFKALDPELQQELRENVQSLKISALRELRYLTPEEIKQVITSGFRTAKQIKQLHARSTKKAVKNTNGARPSYQNDDLDSFEAIEEQPVLEVIECDVELAPGVRVVVKNAKWWDGATGEIKSIKNVDEFWVLLDSERYQGSVTESLFKRSQLEPEVQRVAQVPELVSDLQTRKAPFQTPRKKMYTEEELQAAIAEAFAKKELEEAQAREAKYQESYDAGQKAVDRDVAALEKHAEKLAIEKQQLVAQLQQATQEIKRLQGLHVKNQQLEQRVEDLEKVLESSFSIGTAGAPLSPKTTKKVNSNFVLLLVVLMAEVKELKIAMSTLHLELEQLQAINTNHQKEIKEWRQYSESNTEIEEIIKEFGSLGESLGWNGWNRYGYRAVDGTLHRNIDAIKSFVTDLKHEYQEVPEVVFQN